MKKRIIACLLIIVTFFLLFALQARAISKAQDVSDGNDEENDEIRGLAPVAVSENGKYLINSEGDPFFWMGDTAWDMIHRLTKEEIIAYLDNRQEKGLSVILFRLVLQDLEGEPQHDNVYGLVPFENKDITKPNEAYFELVDFVLDEIEKRGMVAGVLPMWGFVVGGQLGYSVTAEDIEVYANWLSNRYKDRKNIIWVSGGDTGHDKGWEILGRELKKADPEKLVTFHPGRPGISSYHLYGDTDWLDFHMTQTGHSPDLETNYLAINEIYIESDKPILNGEPAYEDMLVIESGGRISPYQVRKAAYWSLLSGGFGHVYGHTEIWQFARAMEGQPDTWGARKPWTEALDAPAVKQIAALSALLRSVPWYRFQPNQALIASSNPTGPAHIRASALDDGSIAWIYYPEKQTATIDLAQLAPLELGFDVKWFDPVTGQVQEVGTIEAKGSGQFESPFAEDALLMFTPAKPGEDLRNNNTVRAAVIGGGLLLVLVLLILVLRQIKAGLGM